MGISQRIDNISVAFREIIGMNKKSMLGLCARNRREWLLSDYAATLCSIVTIPLYPTLASDAFEYITNHAKISCIITDYQTVNEIVDLMKKCKSLKYIILMDDEL